MGAPVVTIDPTDVSLAPGEHADVLVTATDPTWRSGTGTIGVSDSQGNTTNAVVTIVLEDPLTFGAADLSPELVDLVTVQQIDVTADSATYRVTHVLP